MRKIDFANDEVILLEDHCVKYSGPYGKTITLDDVLLSNKRLITSWRSKKIDYGFELKLDDIKTFNGEVQVDYYDHRGIGDSVRIQALNGVHYFSFNTDDSFAAFGDTFMSLFSSKIDSSEKKTQLVWVSKIKEAINSELQVNEEQNSVVTQARKDNDTKNVNVCSKCGKEFDKSSDFCPSCENSVKQPEVVEKVVEVICCRQCGTKMSIDSKFCPSCGTPVIEETKPVVVAPVVEQKKTTREDKIEKCPICGEILPSDAIKCPSCGYEVRGKQANVHVEEFFDSISLIEDEDKKIEAIKMYPIPNSKEDITEFMFLATSNFDAKLYATNNQGENIAGAWYTKIEQCYKKAHALFTDPKDLKVIENLYKEVIGKTKSIKKTKLIMVISGIAAIVVSVIMICLLPRGEDGTVLMNALSYISCVLLVLGVVVLVLGLKKRKTNKQLELERQSKSEKRNRK